MRPNADARPHPKWQIRVAVYPWSTREETLGLKRIGVGPPPPMPMQHPRRDHDQITRRNRQARPFVRLSGGSPDDIRRRVQMHGFINHGACVCERVQRWNTILSYGSLGSFVRDTVLDL